LLTDIIAAMHCSIRHKPT